MGVFFLFLRGHMYKILLIGDDCVDEYQYGFVERISPEAPVPVFNYGFKEVRLGMGSNVKANLEALGCQVNAFLGNKSVKTRLVDVKSCQHIVRIDNDCISKPASVQEITSTMFYNSSFDAIVISDYNKGFVSYNLVEELRKNFPFAPIFIDTKKTDLKRFEGCFVKINSDENNKAISYCSDLIITLGGDGVRYRDVVYKAKKVEVVDVCGAGDTFLSSLVYGYLKQGSIESAIPFANVASSITVQHMGVYAPTLEEIVL